MAPAVLNIQMHFIKYSPLPSHLRLERYNFFKLEQLMGDVKQNSPEDTRVCGKVQRGHSAYKMTQL